MSNRQLYAICYAVLGPKRQVKETKFEYMHADSRVQAERSFRAGHSRALINRRIAVIEVGPALGFHVEDDHGEVLRA